jgi:hypothetical protein
MSHNAPFFLASALVFGLGLIGCSKEEDDGCETTVLEDGGFETICPEPDAATDAGGGGGSDTDASAGPSFPPCQANTDCRGGEVCRDNFCREACASSDPCSGQFRACDLNAGLCVACVSTDDCSESERCVAQVCEFFCRADEQCPQPLYCNFDDGTCFEAECLQDSECQGGFRCDDLRCVPIGGSSIECVGDADCRGGFRCASNRCVPIED